jgi:autophagy-related protein 2
MSLDGLHYKVLGPWTSSYQPRDLTQPILKFAGIGFTNEFEESLKEFRLHMSSSPIRCHLTERFISFMKDFSEVLNKNSNPTSQEQNLPYFQLVSVSRIDVKIDYHASHVNLNALQEGDFIQLLNIFPLDGLELCLKPIKLKGINGLTHLSTSLLEIWVKDIYKNQLHKVITGTSPLKSISSIGSGISGLVYLPLSEYRRNHRLAWKHLSKGTASLVKSIFSETLNVSHQISMLIANSITEIASNDGKAGVSKRRTHNQPRNVQEGLSQAVTAVSHEFTKAVETLVAVPVQEYRRNPSTGLVTSVIRAIPVAILRPIGGIAQGISYTTLGLRNAINPANILEEEDLWNVPDEP